MSQVTESRASSQLRPTSRTCSSTTARRDRLVVTFHLMDGRSFEARIKNFDKFVVICDVEGREQLVFKHAIATIESDGPEYFTA